MLPSFFLFSSGLFFFHEPPVRSQKGCCSICSDGHAASAIPSSCMAIAARNPNKNRRKCLTERQGVVDTAVGHQISN